MRGTESAAIGKPVAMSPSSARSPNFWPMLPLHIHMVLISNCVISRSYHNLTATTSHPEKCLWNQRIDKELRLLPPPSSSRWEISTHAYWRPTLFPSRRLHRAIQILKLPPLLVGLQWKVLTPAQPKFQLGDRRGVLQK